MTSQVKDKDGKAIKEGDTVSGKIRGGKHVGEVDEVVTSKEEASERGVKNPPKVLFTDQHGIAPRRAWLRIGHHVQRNPESLVHGTDPK